jgi:hypothetical protein
MWYGEPGIEPAPVPTGHVISSATCPPQAKTTVSLLEVNVTVIDCCDPESSAAPPRATFVIVPFHSVMFRSEAGTRPMFGGTGLSDIGIGKVEGDPLQETPSQGPRPLTVRS